MARSTPRASKRRASSAPRSAAGSRTTTKRQCHATRPLQLYAPDEAVLVVGDGDFSFSRGLVQHRGTGRGVVATSLDSNRCVRVKYANAPECIAAVRDLHGLVLHDVDATKLQALPQCVENGAGPQPVPDVFQYIVFNFPHSGQQRVHINRSLLLNFFESARDRLSVHGEVHVTLKTQPPYSNWGIEDRARDAGLVLKARWKFDIRLFAGYRHRTTDPHAKKFEPDLCVTYVFVVNRSKYPFQTRRAELLAASAAITASEASEQHDLAAAIVEIAKAKAAASQNVDKVSDVVVRRSQPKRIAAKRPALVAACLEEKKQTNRIRCSGWVARGVLWKPLHRRSGGSIR